MDKPMDPAVVEKQALEARIAELERENKDLWHENSALHADLLSRCGLIDRVGALITGIVGFHPKTPEEAARLLEFAFDLAMEDDEFKAEHQKLLLAAQDRVRKTMKHNREYREASAEVWRIEREMRAIEKAKNAGPVFVEDRIADVKGRLDAAGERLRKMQGSFK